MTLNPELWSQLHGASTHFPVAMSMGAALFEGVSRALPRSSGHKGRLMAAGYYTLIMGALGTAPAVLSGLLMTKGEALGHGALLYHHLFVWAAFVMLIGLAVWRVRMGIDLSDHKQGRYLMALLLMAGLMAGAGYWGGELILNGTDPTASSPSAILPATPELIEKGHQYFSMSCAACHGDDAHGDEGPDLHQLAISNSCIASTIKNGIKGQMPTFARKYDASQISALVAYLRSLP